MKWNFEQAIINIENTYWKDAFPTRQYMVDKQRIQNWETTLIQCNLLYTEESPRHRQD